METRTVIAVKKLLEAKELEREALMMFLSPRTKKHFDAIGKEIKEMIYECISDREFGEKEDHNCDKEEMKKQQTKVKKVAID